MTREDFEKLINYLGEDPQNEDRLLPELKESMFTTESGYRMLGHIYVHGLYASWKLANDQYTIATREAEKLLAKRDYATWLNAWVQKPYRLTLLDQLFRAGEISTQELRYLLPPLWTGSEPDDTDPRWLQLFKDAGYVTDLPGNSSWASQIPIYRGQERDGKLGISWSTNKTVAEFFATRYGRDGEVVYGFAYPNRILGYLKNRSEDEIVIDPSDVYIISITPVSGKPPETDGELYRAIHEGK